MDPGYPNPFSGGSSEVLPTSKYLLAESLVMPTRNMVNLGIMQQISPTVGVNVNLTHIQGSNRLRGRNINAPIDGLRPDPAFGNVTQVESTARMENNQVSVGLNMNFPARRMFIFANYALIDQQNDADGPLQPAGRQLRPRRGMGSGRGHAPPHRQRDREPAAPRRIQARRDDHGEIRHAATTSRPDAMTTGTPCSTIAPPASAATARSQRACGTSPPA